MKRVPFWLVATLCTFVLGLAAVWIYVQFTFNLSPNEKLIQSQSIQEKPIERKSLSGKVEVIFVKAVKNEYNNQIVEFSVDNGLSENISYYSEFSQWDGDYEIRNGKKVEPQWGCVTGAHKEVISSGEQALVRFQFYVRKNGTYEIGLPFEVGSDKRYEIFWSNKFAAVK